jgi:hypothetical protein
MDYETLQQMIAEYRDADKDATTHAKRRLWRDGTTPNAMQTVEEEARRDQGCHGDARTWKDQEAHESE